jgi:tetratricopeptide (TPR) repeat protein
MLFNNHSFYYHFAQLILHIINAILLFGIFKKFLSNKVSFIIALLFLVHPINVESVSFICATIGPLYSFFGLLALFLIQRNNLTKNAYATISSLLLFSLLTKEEGILYLALLPLFCIFFQRKNFKPILICEAIIMFLYLPLRFFIGKAYLMGFGATTPVLNGRYIPITHLGILSRMANMPQIIFYYLKTFFYPATLVTDQIWTITTISLKSFYIPLAADLVFFAILLVAAKKIFSADKNDFKIFMFFFAWFLLGLIMHLQIFPLDMTVADRWFYPSIMGLLGMIGIIMQYLSQNKKARTIILMFSAIILIALSIRTIIRNADFTNEVALFTHDSQIEDNYEIELNLGSTYYATKDLQNAINHYQQSVALFSYEGNLVSLGDAYIKMGKIDLAKKYFLKAYASKSYMPQKHLYITYAGLGWAYLLSNDPKNAKDILELGLREYSDSGDIWLPLTVSYYELNMQKEAINAARRLKILSPNDLSNYVYTYIVHQGPLQWKWKWK